MRTRTRAHVKVGSAPARAARRRVRVRDPEDSPGQGGCPPANPKFPPSRLVGAFDQVVEPLITEITCLRSHELRLFHLVSAYFDSPSVGTTGSQNDQENAHGAADRCCLSFDVPIGGRRSD